MQRSRSKIVTCINNKWWVWKTTLVYHMAHKLAQKWLKVCMVDLDPQTNLTLQSLWGEHYQTNLFSGTYHTIYHVLEWVMKWGWDINTKIQPVDISDNLSIIPWDYRLSYYENYLITSNALGQASSGMQAGYFSLSPVYRYLNLIWQDHRFDVFLVDLSPSLWILNRIVLLGSDYFVVPVNADIFSVQWIQNLWQIMIEWKKNRNATARAMSTTHDIPSPMVLRGDPVFLWYIINEYNVYAKDIIKTHKHRVEELPSKIKDHLSLHLCKNGLVEATYQHPLGTTKDYGKLVSLSQELSQPVYELSNSQAQQLGSLENRDQAIQDFDIIADEMIMRMSTRDY